MRIILLPFLLDCHYNYCFLCQDKQDITDKLEENGQVGGSDLRREKDLLQGRGQTIPNESGKQEIQQ